MVTIKERVYLILTDKLGLDLSEIKDEAHLTNDLGADSLDAVETIMEVESKFDISISEEEGSNAKTVSNLIKLVEFKKGI